jgi:hypothetical protein|tara:strand:- start:344 stop:616 length:273 start_codon:yes stop_codon:yes gene_type:complete
MPRFHNIDGVKVQFTEAEETARDAEEAQWLAKQKSKPIIKEYQTNRKNEYPEIGDQLDMLWHSIDQDAALKQKYFAFHQAILAVKSKYPK